MDVGAGTNLYPSLLMIPWAERIVLTEYAPDNIDWLRKNLADAPGEWPWQPFWDLVADLPGYRAVDDPRRRLAAVHEIRTLSIFDLPPRTWDLGSMFFVADGMTTDEEEFESAVRAFLDALLPGSPFLMAFMEGSGWLRRPWHAVPIGEDHRTVPRRTAGRPSRHGDQCSPDGQLCPATEARI